MSRETEKWLGAAFGFGAGIVWVAAGAGAALVCVVGAGLCAGAVIAREAGLIGLIAAAATGVRKRIEARIPAQRPPRTIGRKQATPKPPQKAAQPKPPQPKTAEPKAAQPKTAQPKAPPKATTQPTSRTEAPAPVVKPKPYDHDEQSGEHVYEVATYGW
jgi:outer membrane biosynthesis protein TonB